MPEPIREIQVMFAGFGGQGLLFAGKVIAEAGLVDDREVSWMPSYGPEMRGGTASCSVTLSDEPIGSPLITEPNILVAMNQPSLDKFIDTVQPGGLVFADTAMIARVSHDRDDITIFELPATQIAEENGLKGLANIVLVGKMFKETQFCPQEIIEKAIEMVVPAKKQHLLEPNKKALAIGMSL